MMNPIQFTCNNCGEIHNKVLPLSTDLTACHRCGNLIDISNLQKRNRRSMMNHNRIGNNDLDDLEEDIYGLNNNNYPMDYYLDEDFYNFDRYESHDDYLPNPNQRNPRFNNNSNNVRRGDNRPFVRNGNRSNSTRGMFSIQIANDNYDRMSAFNRRSNFGYPSNNRNRNRNNYRGFYDIFDDFEDEFNEDFELMALMDNNNGQQEYGLLASILNPPPKPKLKLKKIKMCKDLFTINDNGKSEKPTCCICLGVMKLNDDVTLLKCQHLFHFKCLDKWVESKEACPFCRGKIEFGKIKDFKKKKVEKKVEDKKEDKKEDVKKEVKEEDIKKEDKKEDDKKEDKKEEVKIEDKKIDERKEDKKKTNVVKPIIQKKKSFNNSSLFKRKNSKIKK